MNIIIIKHPESDRYQGILQILLANNLKPLVLEGVMVKDRRAELLEQFGIPDNTMPNGDLGAFLAHVKAWLYIREQGWDKCVIFEDDALPLAHDWLAHLERAYEMTIKYWDYGFMTDTYGNGAHAQIVSQKGVIDLLHHLPIGSSDTVFDVRIWRYDVPQLKVGVYPRIFTVTGNEDYENTSLRLKENRLRSTEMTGES